MRRLGDVLQRLFESGHFSFYPAFRIHMPVSIPDEEFKSRVVSYEAELEAWIAHVNDVRKRHYFINFFDLKRLQKLKYALEQESAYGVSVDSDIIREVISFVNPEYLAQSNTLFGISNALVSGWRAGISAGPAALIAEAIEHGSHTCTTLSGAAQWSVLLHLELLAKVVGNSLRGIPARVRSVVVDEMDAAVVTDRLSRKVHVASAPTLRGEYDLCLTIYAIHSMFPEWENCLICTAQTTFEQVAMLIYRWHGSQENRRERSLYSLVEVESLTYGTSSYYSWS